ncbi:MAG: rubrerythrin [Bacteroidales bacterium]|nr:rubrerythrin [Bacteroidales bacterium]
MKKTLIAIIFTSTLSVVAFQSVTSNTRTNTMMLLPSADESGLIPTENVISQLTALPAGKTTDADEITYQNLQSAFKGESTASAKYAAYSKKAEEEGYHEIALLFKAASVSEKIHAENHKAVLSEAGQKVPVITPEFSVNDTKENLKDAINGEGYEISTMYPEFLTNANTAGNQLALMSLNYAYKTEKKHKPMYEKALAALQSNIVKSLPTAYYVCPTCGNTYESTNLPKRCGISMTSDEKFIRISDLN